MKIVINEYFDTKLYEDIETKLGLTAADFKDNGEMKHCIPCRVENHQQDDRNPAFRWNKNTHTAHCFKCGEIWLAKDIAQKLGIDWRKYIKA